MASVRIDRDRIIDEALALLRAGGLEAVSLRRIAAGLGAGASTLYWHIQGKDELLAALVSRIFRDCLDAVGDQPEWRAWLRAFGLSLWQAQVEIPDVRTLIVSVRSSPDRRNPFTAEIAGMLARFGLDERSATIRQRSVQALVTGWTTLSAIGPHVARGERAGFEAALDALIAGWAAAPLREA